jgi:tetratricopeptide (TPR) repeat protein
VWHRAASDDRLVPLLEDALSALGETDSRLRVQLLSRLAAALRGEPSHERRARLCEEAVQAARRLGEPAVIAYALCAAESAVNGPDTVERRLAEAAEVVALAGSIGDPERVFDGYEYGYWAAWELGDPDRRAAELASLTRVAEELQQPAQLWMAMSAQAALALTQGRFAEAEQLIEQAAAVGERALSWSAAASRRSQDFILRREQGRLEGLMAEIRTSPHEFPSPLLHRSVLAYVSARSEHSAEAGEILEELVGHDLSGWHVDEEWLVGVYLLAETCEILGDTERAAHLYEVLAPYGHLNAVAVPEFTLDSTSRALGLLAALLGRYEDAERHFEEALRMNARMGARPWVAQTEHDYARMLAARGEPGDRERALELAGRALEGYRSLGMDSYAADAARLQRSLEVAPAV